MNNIEIAISIQKKLDLLPAGISIVTPGSTTIETQADLLVFLLQTMYTRHALTNNHTALLDSLASGACRCWFALDQNQQPIASAALIAQSDGAVELGRAVSLQPGVGGLLMLMATLNHFQTSTAPLVAEIRVPQTFQGIPSGVATQRICLGWLDLIPHAFLPAFGHGEPFRKEPFIFASSAQISNSEPMAIPDSKRAGSLVFTAFCLAQNLISNLQSTHHSSQIVPHGWEILTDSPFSVISPTPHGPNLETALQVTKDAFILIPIETSPASIPLVLECLNQHFTPCGVDRNLGPNGHPILLLGRLKPNTLLAPMHLNPQALPEMTRGTLMFINDHLRRNQTKPC